MSSFGLLLACFIKYIPCYKVCKNQKNSYISGKFYHFIKPFNHISACYAGNCVSHLEGVTVGGVGLIPMAHNKFHAMSGS